jgi:uncharacterized protein
VRVVLDANVYVSALIRPAGPPGQSLDKFLRSSAFELLLSPAIVEETLRAFRYPKVRRVLRPGVNPEAWLEGIILLARLIAGDRTIRPLSQDPADDKYIAAALEGAAHIVVSGDADLLAIGQHEGIRILTPRAFLDLLAR